MEQKFINQKYIIQSCDSFYNSLTQEYFGQKGCYQACFYLDLI